MVLREFLIAKVAAGIGIREAGGEGTVGIRSGAARGEVVGAVVAVRGAVAVAAASAAAMGVLVLVVGVFVVNVSAGLWSSW